MPQNAVSKSSWINPITIIVSGLALLVGIAVGYQTGANKGPSSPTSGAHQMANGAVMMNGAGPITMASMMEAMNAQLEGKTQDEFDKAFLSEMVGHHQGAILMAQSALENAQHQEIKDLATIIIAAQTEEIGKMQAWQKAWYGLQ